MRTLPLLLALSLLCPPLLSEVFYRLTCAQDPNLTYSQASISLFSAGSLARIINGNSNRYLDVTVVRQQNTPGVQLSPQALEYLNVLQGDTLLVRLLRAPEPLPLPSGEAAVSASDLAEPPWNATEAASGKDNTLIIKTEEENIEVPLFDRRRPQEQNWQPLQNQQHQPLAGGADSSPSSTDDISRIPESPVLTLNQPSPSKPSSPGNSRPRPAAPRGPAPQPLWPETRVIKRTTSPQQPANQTPLPSNPVQAADREGELSLVPPPVLLPRATPAEPLTSPTRKESLSQPVDPPLAMEKTVRTADRAQVSSPPSPPSGWSLRPTPPLSLDPSTSGHVPAPAEPLTAPTSKGSLSQPVEPPLVMEKTVKKADRAQAPPPPSPPSGWVLRSPTPPLPPAPPTSEPVAGPEAEGEVTNPPQGQTPEPTGQPFTLEYLAAPLNQPGPPTQLSEPERPATPPNKPGVLLPQLEVTSMEPRASYYIQVGVYRKLDSLARFLETYARRYPYEIARLRLAGKVVRRCLLGPFDLQRAQALLPQIRRQVRDAFIVERETIG